MRGLLARGEQRAAAEQRRRIDMIAERLRAELPYGTIAARPAGLTVAARGLMRRWLSDPRLRFLGRGQ